MSARAYWTFVAMMSGCAAPGGNQRTSIPEPNHLGATAMETDRFGDATSRTFELRALDANDDVVARVRMQVGHIDGLGAYVPNATVGSEIVLATTAQEERMFSTETQRHVVGIVHDDDLKQLVRLASVSSTLEHEANIIIAVPSDSPDEAPYNAGSCPDSWLLTSPTAQQCCATASRHEGIYTIFARPSDGAVIYRARNPNGNACVASDGVSSCDGASCYYGPNSFARPAVYAPQGTPYIFPTYIPDEFGMDWFCAYDWSGTTPYWGDVTGSFPTSQGCPGGGTGDGDWDY